MQESTISRRGLLRSVGGLAATTAVGSAVADADSSDRYIVGVESTSVIPTVESVAEQVHNTMEFGAIGSAVVGTFTRDALDGLERRPGIRYVEADIRVQALSQRTPCGVDRIDADVTRENGDTGSGVDVAIIDSGIDSDHPDLEANLGAGKAWVTCSGSHCKQPWDDDSPHGSQTAGIVGAVDDGSQVVGVAPDVTLHAAKVLDDTGSGWSSDVADAIRWTADQGYDVGSLSLGGGYTQAKADACRYAYDNGVLLVASSGNGSCSDCVIHPARHPDVIAVSAWDCDGHAADYNSRGPEVELMGMADVTTTHYDGTKDYNFAGTSAACPHVSGVGALLMANGNTNVEARQRMQQTAEDVGLSGDEQGYGLVNADVALYGEERSDPGSDGGGGDGSGDDGGSGDGGGGGGDDILGCQVWWVDCSV